MRRCLHQTRPPYASRLTRLGPANSEVSMLAHHTYPKDAPESKALRSAFTCSGLLICLIATLVLLDVAVRSDPATLSGREGDVPNSLAGLSRWS